MGIGSSVSECLLDVQGNMLSVQLDIWVLSLERI